MGDTRIAWCTKVLNVVTGCTKVSPGCAHCYAARMARRLAGRAGYPEGDGFAVTLHPDRLAEPARWREPQRIFMPSMGDLFHNDVPDDFVIRCFEMMWEQRVHTFLILTKRPGRMADLSHRFWWGDPPLPNIWLGVSVEDQKRADERIPLLLQTPAAIRWVSAEPLLGPVNLWRACPPNDGIWDQLAAEEDVDGPAEPEELVEECEAERDWISYGHDLVYNPEHAEWLRARCERAHFLALSHGIDWIVAGSETGPGARPCDPEWLRSLRDQATAAGVAFYLKQTSTRPGIGTTLDGREWREFPKVGEAVVT